MLTENPKAEPDYGKKLNEEFARIKREIQNLMS